MSVSKKIESLSFEEALSELEKIVASLEAGKMPLEEAIDGYTRGSELKAHCEKKLEQAKLKVEKLKVKENGEIEAVSFDS
jgi:exodeoxyribonuclease VII small subunit